VSRHRGRFPTPVVHGTDELTVGIIHGGAERTLALRVAWSLPAEFHSRLLVGVPTQASVWVVLLDPCSSDVLEKLRSTPGVGRGIGLAGQPDAPCWAEVRKWMRRVHPVDDLGAAFRSEIRDVFDASARERLCSGLWGEAPRRADHREIRRVVERAILSGTPLTSVDDLAHTCHCDPSTLRRRWRNASPAETPKAFIALHLLFEATLLRVKRRSVESIAARLGTSRTTLHRLSHSYFGRPFTEVTLRDITDAFGLAVGSGKEVG
jgi:AraC-like DNA-binding protein